MDPKLCIHGYDCSYCDLTTLKGAPNAVKKFSAFKNKKLSSLEHAPQIIETQLNISATSITSLHNIHKQIKYLKQIFLPNDVEVTHILGLMLIEGLNTISQFQGAGCNTEAFDIVDKYLKQPMSKQRMFDCQDELMQAGFKEYAQL